MSVSCGCTLCRRLAEESTRPQQPARARAAGRQRREVSDTLRAVAEELATLVDHSLDLDPTDPIGAGLIEECRARLAGLRARLEEVDRG